MISALCDPVLFFSFRRLGKPAILHRAVTRVGHETHISTMATAPARSISETSSPARHAVVAGFVFALLGFWQLFVFPALPMVPSGDEVLWLVDGQRINHGQVIYRDFSEVTFPGVQYFYALVQRTIGVYAWIPKATYLLLGAITAGLIFSIARRVLPGRLPWLAVALYLVGPFFVIPDATHHWFAALFAYAALWIALRATRPRGWAFAGACCAAATWFMQTKGVFVLLALGAFLIWRRRRSSIPLALELAALVSTFAAVLAVLLIPTVAAAGLQRFLHDTVGFVLTGWGNEFFGTWRIYMAFAPSHSSWADVPGVIAFLLVYGAVPLVYILFAVRYFLRKEPDAQQPWEELVLIAAVGVALFLAVVKAPSTVRIASGSAPAMILLAWLLRAPGRVERAALRLAWIVVLLLAVACPLVRQAHWHAPLETRAGRAEFLDPAWRDTMSGLLPLLPPGEPCFGNHVACYLAGDVVVGPVNFIFDSDYTTPAQVDRLIRDLDSHRVPNLVLRAIFYLPVDHGAQDRLALFRAYLTSHYRLKKMFPNNDELWVRAPDAPHTHSGLVSHINSHNFSSVAPLLRN
jgi:hypothetical protein